MPEDRLEKILSDLSAEVESRAMGDETRLAEWFGSVVDHEHTKNERRVAFIDALRQGHGSGAGEENEETEENA